MIKLKININETMASSDLDNRFKEMLIQYVYEYLTDNGFGEDESERIAMQEVEKLKLYADGTIEIEYPEREDMESIIFDSGVEHD